MEQAELVILILGIVVALLAVSVHLINHRRQLADDSAPVTNPGLITRLPSSNAPEHVTPAMVGALLEGRTGMRDVFVAIADLASRGYVTIHQLTPQDTRVPPDWEFRRTTQVASALDEADRAVLMGLFTTTEPADAASTPAAGILRVRFGVLLADRSGPLATIRSALRTESMRHGWFHRDPHDHHTMWGWIGGVLTILGLVLAVFSAIDVMATGRWLAMLGPLLVVAGGLVLASLGRTRAPRSPLGKQVHSELLSFRRHLQKMAPESVEPDRAPRLFSTTLPYALAFGDAEHFAATLATVAQRSARWGKPVNYQLDWFTEPGLGVGNNIPLREPSDEELTTTDLGEPVVAFARTLQAFVNVGGNQADHDSGD